jgi:hypothetical protein
LSHFRMVVVSPYLPSRKSRNTEKYSEKTFLAIGVTLPLNFAELYNIHIKNVYSLFDFEINMNV